MIRPPFPPGYLSWTESRLAHDLKRPKRCKICRAEFLATPIEKTCSPACSHINRLRNNKKWHARRRAHNKKPPAGAGGGDLA